MRVLRRFSSPLQKIAPSSEGVTALEFAMIAPVLIAMLMGTIEISLMMFAQYMLESATHQASRTGKTGYSNTAANQTQAQTIASILNARAALLFDTSKLSVSSLAYAQFDQIGQPEPFTDSNNNGVRDANENYTDVNLNGQYDIDMGRSSYGTSSEVVVYTATYPWPIFTPVVNQFIGQNGTITLSSRFVVKNEPY